MANAPAASAGRPNCEHESDDEEEAVQTTAPERDPGNCVEPGNASHYGQFTWTVALPAAPADKDSLADISKIRQFRFPATLFSFVLPCVVPSWQGGQHSTSCDRCRLSGTADGPMCCSKWDIFQPCVGSAAGAGLWQLCPTASSAVSVAVACSGQCGV